MKTPPALIHQEDRPLEILQIFDDTGVWNLPVVDDTNKFVGFISKSKILMSYRQLLKNIQIKLYKSLLIVSFFNGLLK
jgi:CIC family chloride channel protein